jgi:N-acetylmuramoyl-L-alanine amidase
VPFNIQAWHAGRSEYKKLKSLNQFTIGIELMNAGKLSRKNNKFYTYYREEIPVNQVMSEKTENGPLTFWHIYTEKQITSLIKVCKAIKKEYPQLKEIIGHSDITNRKIDPGEAFPWHKIKV